MTPIENKIRLGSQTITFETYKSNDSLFSQSVSDTFREK